MSWVWSIRDGKLWRNGVCDGQGYSGYEGGKNNPDVQTFAGMGPIPEGNWIISGPPRDTDTHGPYVLTLVPEPSTNTFGRSGFLVHGDSIESPGNASRGCIILSRPLREAIWESSDRALVVVAEHLANPFLDEETTKS